MTTTESEFSDQLLEWGRNGSFYPNFVPSEDSTEALQIVQNQIQSFDTEAEISTNLHTTLFYCKPVNLFDYIKTCINPEVNEVHLYSDIGVTIGAFCMSGMLPTKDRPVSMFTKQRLKKFGDGTAIVLELISQTSLLRNIRRILVKNLQLHGVNDQEATTMGLVPEFKWLLGTSRPHITLAHSQLNTEKFPASLPSSITFDKVCFGSSQFPEGANPLQWLLMGA